MKKTIIYITVCILVVVSIIVGKTEFSKRFEIYEFESNYKKSMREQNYSQAFVDAGNVANIYLKYHDLENYQKWDSIQFSLSSTIRCPY